MPTPATPAAAPRPAAFIDRDGVINEERDYVHRVEDFALLPGAADGLAALQAAGYALVVVTNQSGIGRGYYTERDFATLTAHLRALLRERGVELDAVYHCPHDPADGPACDCRKPAPGMLLRAARERSLDLARSVIVGDRPGDVQAGRAAGLALGVLVESGHAIAPADRALADACVADLRAAAAWILARRPSLT